MFCVKYICAVKICIFCGFIVLVSACDQILGSRLDNKPIITREDFAQAQGYKLPYNIYLPSTYTGWFQNNDNIFHFEPSSMTYVYDRVVLGQKEVDDLGTRFKISNVEWHYQFGFGPHELMVDESAFGLTSEGIVLRLYFSTISTKDMRIEMSEEDLPGLIGKNLRFELKVLDDSNRPDALLLVTVE